MALNKNRRKSKLLHPSRTIALSFFLMITVGTLLFMLPFMTRDGKGLSFMEALFTTTSSVCVTGLTLIDPAVTLTRYGQILLMMLIEAGGISMVTFATFFIFSIKKHSGFRSLRIAQEYTSIDTFSQVKPLVRTIIGTTVICQVIGAALLCIRFIPKMGARLMSLDDPTTKMSKSLPDGCVNLMDKPEEIMKKFKRAVTDCETAVKFDKENKAGISNLLTIYCAATGKTVAEAEAEFAGQGYGVFKPAVGEAVVELLRPIREESERLMADKAYIESVYKTGAERAQYLANKTLSKVQRKIGFVAR